MFIQLASLHVSAASNEEVRHSISFPDRAQQYVRIVSEFPTRGASFELILANWNPGAYEIRDFSSDLDELAVRDENGQVLSVEKVRKNAWRVSAGDAKRITASYSVHAGELSVSTSWVSPDFVLLNPATSVLYTEDSRPLRQVVRVSPSVELGRAWTPLAEHSVAGEWAAVNFDELIDSPIVVTNNSPLAFETGAYAYRLLNIGNEQYWDLDTVERDLQALVREINDFWPGVPLQRPFWFFNFLVEQRGGLEHDHSTVIMASRWQMRSRSDYIKWLALAAHEYFHVWNVRRMRPAAFAEYDLENERYSPDLWIAEGITSYYDNLLPARAGLITANEYLQQLAVDLHRYELTPGREKITLTQASRDAWIRHYQPDANSINSTVSYYAKGAVVALALDVKIRAETDGRKSLDDVMGLMWETWSDTAYPPGAFAGAVEQVAGERARLWLEPLVSQIEDPDIDAALDYFGLALDRHPERTAARAAGSDVAGGLGVNWKLNEERLVVGSVVDGYAAAAAGILPGDELIAINKERVLTENLDVRLRQLGPGTEVDVLIARQQQLIELSVTLNEARPVSYFIGSPDTPSRRQLRRLGYWLGEAMNR